MTSALEQPVYVDGVYKPFGEFTQAEVEARSQELKAAATGPATARVGGVARAWSALARSMAEAGVERVADLDPGQVDRLAGQLWVIPPGGSLL